MAFTIFDLYRPFMKHFRGKRFRWFLQRIVPKSGERLLDIGGFSAFWINQEPVPVEVDCLNLNETPQPEADPSRGKIRTLVGNGCALDFPDDSYDIVFSNSVIEHVGPWEEQVKFAQESRRVGKALWVQTPAYGCPMEPHYITPFMHWLPKELRRKMARWFSVWGLVSKPSKAEIDDIVDNTRILRKRQMQELFPDCEILTERLLWIFPKSYIALRASRE